MVQTLAEIAVTLPVEGRFSYLLPDHLRGELQVGHRVLVPFGSRRVTGFVLSLLEVIPQELDASKLKTIEARLDRDPLVPPSLLELCRFASDYYLAPLGEVLKVALPPGFTGASKLRYVVSPEGRAALKTKPSSFPNGPAARAIHWVLLDKALKRGLSPKQTSATKLQIPNVSSRQIRAAITTLETYGWLVIRDALSARIGDGEVEIVERLEPIAIAEPYLRGAATRRAVYDALESQSLPLAELKSQFGARRLAPILKRLQADQLVQVRKQAASLPPSSPSAIPPAPLWVNPDQPELSPEQQSALAALKAGLKAAKREPFLLHGVTGSGKTEVYLGIIEHALRAGFGAIMLVPEIALTPQLEARFQHRFGQAVAVLHSGLSDGERRQRWHKLRTQEARIALGPRSAIWAPVDPLGIVVVDEEHDASFKQHNELRYHGRDLALTRAHQAGAMAVLGSATPSLETLHLAQRGRINSLRLRQRVAGRPMPTVQLVDLCDDKRSRNGQLSLISRKLEDALRELPSRGEQGILFLNRRGFNTIVHCGACDDVRKCPHCDVSLTYHRTFQLLRCHYCDHQEPFQSPCLSCGARDVRPMGAGTERVVDAVKELVPNLRILRLDRDVVQNMGEMKTVLDQFRAGEADLLVGTQMVAKGHDFPLVTLVGIVLADASLAFPDFRAAERTFQLVTQVAGRAGRATRPGRVIVQTLQPDHYALACALQHDVDAFYALESPARQEALYPPYHRLGVIRAEGLNMDHAQNAAEIIAAQARKTKEDNLRVLGPAPAPIGRIRDRYRYMVLLFAPTPARLAGWMRRIQKSVTDTYHSVDVSYDVDAVDLL
ncbi:MAG: primosomal protein N' [Myxococcales bacterium]|nr:primosomal protein N' [Myxococcales bacterium]